MRKKAMIMTTVVKIIVALAVIVLLSLIFFIGGSALFPQIKGIIPSWDEEVTANYYEDNPEYQARFVQAQEGFVDFVSAYKKLAEAEMDENQACFETFDRDGMLHLLKDHHIDITNDGGKTTIMLLRNVKEEDGQEVLSTAMPPVTFEGVEPCVVMGEGEAQTFYDNYLDTLTPAIIRGGDLQAVNKLRLQEKHYILVNGQKQLNLWDVPNENEYVLYRHNNKICLFPDDLGGFLSGFSKRCEERNGVLTKDCFDKDYDESLINSWKYEEFLWKPQDGRCHGPIEEPVIAESTS